MTLRAIFLTLTTLGGTILIFIPLARFYDLLFPIYAEDKKTHASYLWPRREEEKKYISERDALNDEDSPQSQRASARTFILCAVFLIVASVFRAIADDLGL